MPKFRIDTLGELARQLRFTPVETRAAQLDAAEELLFSIDPAKAYPADFVIFRITGYHPKPKANADLLTGLALQHDLGLLIEQVSDSLDVRTLDLAEPVLQIDDVCERFNVTSKTIQRWRRKGLPARRFIFPDGKRRFGFLLHSVERFFAQNRDQVQRGGGNFSQVDEAERQQILRWARRLAVECRCCPQEIARRIARRLKRSPVTIHHTIRKHDEENPQQAIFPLAAAELSAEERAIIVAGRRRGATMAALARKLGRPRSAIYRVLLEERVEKLSRKKVRFIDDPLFHGEGAEEAIEAIVSQEPIETGDIPADELRIPRDLPPYLAALYRTPLLSAAQERGLFLQLNFRKYQFVQARRRLDPQFARARDLNLLEGLLRRVHETRNRIVQANLRLVVSVARKHLRPGLQLMELVSEGNLVLLRAVDGFDVSKGNRFSTYATLALMKGFARSVPQMLQRGRLLVVDEAALATVADPAASAGNRQVIARDELRRLVVSLDARERDVLLAHWGVGERPFSYDELGARMGLSRQRVRQIEQSALRKLREAAGSE